MKCENHLVGCEKNNLWDTCTSKMPVSLPNPPRHPPPGPRPQRREHVLLHGGRRPPALPLHPRTDELEEPGHEVEGGHVHLDQRREVPRVEAHSQIKEDVVHRQAPVLPDVRLLPEVRANLRGTIW